MTGATTGKPGARRGRESGTGKPAARRGREGAKARRARAAEIVRRLRVEYPDARCSLDHRNPFELLVATILSAQCTDERVNQVVPELFRRYPEAEALAGARQEELEEVIRSTGFFRSKARNLIGMATALAERHGGRVPERMDALVRLPGVGRKTANVVLGNAFGRNDGVVVDTHVKRLSGRLGLTRQADPEKVEADLQRVIAREDWTDLAHLLIYHGRAVCKAPRPRCETCALLEICPAGANGARAAAAGAKGKQARKRKGSAG